MWSVRKSYDVVLCTTCSGSLKNRCFICKKAESIFKAEYKAVICSGCAPSKRLRCTKCTHAITHGGFMGVYICEGCLLTQKDKCAKCGSEIQ